MSMRRTVRKRTQRGQTSRGEPQLRGAGRGAGVSSIFASRGAWRNPRMRSRMLFLLLLSLPLVAAAKDAPKRFGWVEQGLIRPENIAVKVKLDTGALTSSMHAENLQRFEKDGEEWIRFTVSVTDIEGKQRSDVFERKLLREVEVRGAAGEEERPIVRMSICIGDTIYTEPFSLNDRDDMNYPVLIGRRTIDDMGVVDVTRTFTAEPVCSKTED